VTVVPEIVPILSAGKHRSPRSGGCFMEMASFLAGEPWSDHPRCTDPALAELGRCVNDVMPDSQRSRLSPMIPSVIGVAGRTDTERTRLAALVVRDAIVIALPLVTAKARPLACALLVAERVLEQDTAEAAAVLATQPAAADFARGYLRDNPTRWREPRAYHSLAVPQAIRCAVRTVADELGGDAPDILITMLRRATDSARAECGFGDDTAPLNREWQKACDLVGAVPVRS
jgi:hypothetical protein